MRLSLLRTAVYTSAVSLALAIAPTAMAGNGENLVQYVPEGTDAMIAVNVERLRGTAIYSDATALITGLTEYRETIGTLTASGVTFDPMTDVNTMLLAIPALNETESSAAVLIVEADFDTAQVVTAAQANNYAVQTVGTVQYFVARDKTVAILAPGIVALGDSANVQRIINGSAGAGSVLRATVRAADKSDTIWFAATGTGPDFGAAHGSVDLSSGLVAGATIVVSSPELASAMVTELSSRRAALATDATVAAFGLTAVVNGVTVTSNEANVTFGLSLDAASWSSLSTRLLAILESEL